jgi:mono/diheme cytochrome c family protein
MKRIVTHMYAAAKAAMLAFAVAFTTIVAVGCTGQANKSTSAPSMPIAKAGASSSQVIDLAAAFYARPVDGGEISLNPSLQIKEPVMTGTPQAENSLVMRGQYLARVGDCIGCHSRPGGLPFAGGLPLKTPFGTIISTNITPDKEQGIGNYKLSNFDAALRHGLDEEGGNLYPAMPYTNYARMTDEDLAALFAYFMQAVPAAKQDNAHTSLAWPFSMKWLLKGWNWLYLPRPGFTQDTKQSSDWNRGAYLVQGLAHCSACHTPRNAAGAETAATEKEGDRFLSGALIDGWYAQPLRSGIDKTGRVGPGLNQWSVADIADYLRDGRNKRTAAFGAMTDVVGHSTQYFSPQDLTSVAVYLKSLGNSSTQSVANLSVNVANPSVSVANPSVSAVATSAPHSTTLALCAGNVTQRGALLYLNNCSGCHRSDGEGAERTFPALARSSSVTATDATSLIRIVLQGSAMPSTVHAPSALAMPGFAWRLNDEDVANVLSFVRSSWDNQAGSVTASEVAKVRADINPPHAHASKP